MKKGKIVITVTVGLVCFVLTYIMFLQFKTVEETNITEIETLTETELREKIVSWREKYEELNKKLEETNIKIAEYRKEKESNQETSKLLDKELLQAQILAGETVVKGDGVVVTIIDKKDTEYSQEIRVEDILYLLNELRAAGAEAISINDQRIINMSDIADIDFTDGSHYMLVNKEEKFVSTYVVKAIGDPKYLESALTTKDVGFMDKYRDNATLERQNNITIPKYSGEIKIKYIDMKGEKLK